MLASCAHATPYRLQVYRALIAIDDHALIGGAFLVMVLTTNGALSRAREELPRAKAGFVEDVGAGEQDLGLVAEGTQADRAWLSSTRALARALRHDSPLFGSQRRLRRFGETHSLCERELNEWLVVGIVGAGRSSVRGNYTLQS